jgi:hypothetical protein
MLEVPLALDAALLDRLRAVFRVDGDELQAVLGELASAALTEYALAFSGIRSPATMRELRELRLRLLYESLSGERPTDRQVAEAFQLTPAQATTLIAGTRARFAPELEGAVRRAAVAVLGEARPVDEDTVRIRVPDSLARYLKDLVGRTAAPPLDKRRDASQTYDLTRSTVSALCRELGVEQTVVRALRWE